MERHRPVMPEEVIDLLAPGRGGLVIDATLGMGGHTELILDRFPNVRVMGLDRDAESLAMARERLARFGDRFVGVHRVYRELRTVMAESEIAAVAGILVDLGISSYQLDTLERGFSFRAKSAGGPEIGPEIGPEADLAVKSDIQLDMRMDRSVGVTAADLVNRLSEQELADLIYKFGEERASRRIARRIVQERAAAPIQKTVELAELVVRAVNQKGYWKIHPATKTFQALRIAVNRELEGLDSFVATAVDLLEPEGRLVMITFHSLEDREIKQAFRFQAGQCQCPPTRPRCECGAVRRVELLTRKALRPGDVEISANPRARSAKLRACRKLAVV
ncbi:MAG: 16S rRNA (cytosine(1402)-N(4))-methyltransferase RsmH [Blastocatellia bacterium]